MRSLRIAFSLFAALVTAGCDCFNALGPSGDPGSTGSSTRPITLVVTGQTSLYVGTSTPLTATATFADGTRRNVTELSTWASSNGNICSMAGGGQTTGMAPGSCVASASFQQVSATLGLTVLRVPEGGAPPPPPSSDSGTLFVTGAPSLRVGDTTQWDAWFTQNGSQSKVTASSAWSSDNPGVAAVNGSGLVSGVAQNTTTIRVTYLGRSASGPIQVTAAGSTPPSVVSLNIVGTPCSTSGGSAQLQAMAQLSDGTTQNVTTTASWSSTQGGVASVTAGLVSCQSPGTTTISASYSGRDASVPVTVTAPPSGPTVVSLTITGTPCSTIGSSAQLQAVAGMSDGTSQTVTSVASWTSSASNVATVSSGLVSCQAAGTTQIGASYSGHSASVPVTVSGGNQPPVLIGIEVEIEANAIGSGSSLALPLSNLLNDPLLDIRVYALYSNNTRQEVTAASVITPDNPLLVVNGPGVLNAAGVLAQALVDPNHYVNVQYGGFTVLAGLQINTPVLGTLPISSLQLPSIATLAAGTQLPNVTAVLNNGFGGTTNLIVPAGTAGLVFQATPPNYVPILGPIVGATVNATLTPLGDLVGDVIFISNGAVQSINTAPLGGIVSVLGGVLQVDTRAVVGAITSNSVSTVIPL